MLKCFFFFDLLIESLIGVYTCTSFWLLENVHVWKRLLLVCINGIC